MKTSVFCCPVIFFTLSWHCLNILWYPRSRKELWIFPIYPVDFICCHLHMSSKPTGCHLVFIMCPCLSNHTVPKPNSSNHAKAEIAYHAWAWHGALTLVKGTGLWGLNVLWHGTDFLVWVACALKRKPGCGRSSARLWRRTFSWPQGSPSKPFLSYV